MKKALCAVLSLLMLLTLPSCGGDEETTAPDTSEITEYVPPVDDTVYISAKDYYNNGYSNNYVVGVDKLGRTFDASIPKTDKERQVGIFYFMTLGQHLGKYSDKIYDTNKILQMENGLELLFSLDHLDEDIAPAGAPYFWSEPLFGYYNSTDVWVIRRHLQLLSEAGVDFLVFDVTNAVTYDAVYPLIMREICALKEQGFADVPEAVFYTHSYSTVIINKLYNDVYSQGLYIYKTNCILMFY